MKTSLGQIPLAKQQKLESLAALIQREAEVEMIILYGSHARGDWVEDTAGGYFSDYDVLVIVKSPKLIDKHDIWSRIEQLAQPIVAPTELSLIAHDIKDVNEQLEKGLYFFSDIKREGIILYNSGRFTLAQEKQHTL